MSTIKVNTIYDSSGGNTAVLYGVLSTAVGMRNRIINGKMDIGQRGTSFTSVANGAYTLDRWMYGKSGVMVTTVSRQADVPTGDEFQNSLRLAVTTADTSIAAGDYCVVEQRIEGYNVRDLIGKPFTISFWVRSSKTGTHCVSLANSGGDRSYVSTYTISAANTWERKSITVSVGLITAGTWDWTNGFGLTLRFAVVAGTTYQTVNTNSWQTGNFLCTSGQVNGTDVVGNIFAITGVQLEAGEVASPFEHRPFGHELMLCQRYFEKSYAIDVTPGTATRHGNFQTTATTSWIFACGSITFNTAKRGSPTMAYYSPNGGASGVAAEYNAGGTFVADRAIATDSVSTTNVQIAGGAGNMTTGNHMRVHWTATSEL